MSMNHDRTVLAYHFLMRHKVSQTSFTVDEIMESTGWAKSTVKTYMTKKWHRHIRQTNSGYLVVGFDGYTLDRFIELHTQKAA